MNLTTNNRVSITDYAEPDAADQWADVDHPLFYWDPGFKSHCHHKLNELHQLKDGWDDQGGLHIAPAIISAVRAFVDALPDHIATRPMVVPLSSGNVQLEWHHGPMVLELEFESPTEVHYLKWDPTNGIEDEDAIPIADQESLVELIRWFMRGMLDG